MSQRRGAFPGGNHDWNWDFDAAGDLDGQMRDLKEQLKEQLGNQRGIIREAVTQAHEAGRRARDDAHRAADQLRIFFEDDGATKASKIDLGKAQIVFSDDFSVVQSRPRKTSTKCRPTCVNATIDCNKMTCPQ